MSVGMEPSPSGGLLLSPSGACPVTPEQGSAFLGVPVSVSGGAGSVGIADVPSSCSSADGSSGELCDAPAGGPNPDGPPGPGSPYSVTVKIFATNVQGNVAGPTIKCVETGVTQPSLCSGSGATFYFNQTGTYTLSTPGGPGNLCSGGNAGTCSASSTTVVVPTSAATINVIFS